MQNRLNVLSIFVLVVRKPQKVSRLGADPNWKFFWRTIRSYVCHNHKVYYSFVILNACLVYQFWWHTCVGYYRRRNHHRSLEVAIQREKEWALIKPKDDDYGDEDYGEEDDAAAEAGGEAPADGGDAEEDE